MNPSPRLDVETAATDTRAVKTPTARQLDLVAAAHGRSRPVKVLFSAVLWLGSMVVVLIGSLIGIAAWKPAALGFITGFVDARLDSACGYAGGAQSCRVLGEEEHLGS